MKHVLTIAGDIVLWAGIYFGLVEGNEYVANLTLFCLWALGLLSLAVLVIGLFAADGETQAKIGREIKEIPGIIEGVSATSAFVRFMVIGALGFYVTASLLFILWLTARFANRVFIVQAERA